MIETGDVAARPQVRDERAVDAREIGVGRAPHRRPRRSLRLRLQARKGGREEGRNGWADGVQTGDRPMPSSCLA